eukprot:8366332-Alexandrium_andersonii.AAC.1
MGTGVQQGPAKAGLQQKSTGAQSEEPSAATSVFAASAALPSPWIGNRPAEEVWLGDWASKPANTGRPQQVYMPTSASASRVKRYTHVIACALPRALQCFNVHGLKHTLRASSPCSCCLLYTSPSPRD